MRRYVVVKNVGVMAVQSNWRGSYRAPSICMNISTIAVILPSATVLWRVITQGASVVRWLKDTVLHCFLQHFPTRDASS